MLPIGRHLAQQLGLLVWSLLIAAGMLLCFVLVVSAQPVCTAYASPTGSGSTCAESSPCTVGTWLSSQAGPGKVLCLHDGTYTGEQGMLQFAARSGTAGSPITVRALHDGAVTIDGQHSRRPLDCNASYITVQGLDVANGNDTTLVLRGQHCTVQRVVAWADAPDDGAIENVCDVGGAHNLLEDSACLGYARKTFAAGARGGTGPNTIRRSYLEFHGAPPGSAQGNPTNVLEIGYGQSNVTAENVIVRRNVLSSATEPEAPIMAFQTHGSALLGSIAFAAAQDTVGANRMMDIVPDAGSSAGSGFVTSTMLVQDVAIFVDPGHTNIKSWQITGGNGSTGNVARRLLAVAPQGAGTCTGEGWSCTEMYGGTTLGAALGSKTIWDTLPGVCKRVVNRQLTDVGLWPLPITARVQAALGQARLPQRDILADVEARLGTIPEKCRSANGGPGPEPPPGVPVPPSSVTTVLQGTNVLVSWVDTVNTVQTGYTLERKVGSGAYVELTQAPGAAARSYTDQAPGPGAQNCYVVYARGPAGPSGLSPASCVAVPGTPMPPSASHVPLACHGMVGEGGNMALVCQPQGGRR